MMGKKWIAGLLLLMSLSGCEKEKPINNLNTTHLLAWGFSIEGFPISRDYLEQLEKETLIAPQIIQFYLQWPNPPSTFDPVTPSLTAIANAGATPCMTWEPMFIEGNSEHAIPFEAILNGQYDAYLNEVAKELKEWNKPIIIRFAQEMNLKRYHWGTSEEKYSSDAPEIYIKMFRYIVTKFRELKVTNVFWAFCPNVDSVPDLPWNKAKHYYPGHDFVDLLGMDGYNWAITPQIAVEKQLNWTKPWVSFEGLFSSLYQELNEISTQKPIVVFETATAEREGGKKNLWLKDALQTAKKWNLMGIIWFQAKKEEDWRLQEKNEDSYVPIIREATSPISDWLKNKSFQQGRQDKAE